MQTPDPLRGAAGFKVRAINREARRRQSAGKRTNARTGPRPTILRVLHTLQESGLVWRGMSDGLWRTGYRLERLARPRDPSDRLAEIAAPTWFGRWYEMGGGGTPWDAIVYDVELDQLYVGTGNGSPWNRQIRSDGQGDNLFLASVLALDPVGQALVDGTP